MPHSKHGLPAHPPRVLLASSWRDNELTQALADCAQRLGWHLDLTMHIYGELPDVWQGDGILAHPGERKDIAQFVRRTKLPAVCLTTNQQGLEVPYADVDNRKVGRMAAEHLLQRGFRRFAFYAHTDSPVALGRGESFAQAIRDAGHHDFTMLLWDRHRKRQRNSWSNRQKWLQGKLQKLAYPTALFAMDDLIATEVIEACRAIEIAVPEKIAVMGVGNNFLLARGTSMPMTSVAVDFEQIAQQASEMLHCLMQGKSIPSSPFLGDPLGVIVRRSTDTIAVEDSDVASAVRFMLDHYSEPITVQEVLAQATMSQSQFYQAFASHLGRSPANVLTDIRLEKAKRLLKETDLKLNQIAKQCGLNNQTNLYRVFQRILGISPGNYRRHRSD